MIIGISGKIGAGKDTIGHIIRWLTNHEEQKNWDNSIHAFLNWHLKSTSNNWNWEIRKFADKLKDMICLLIGCTRSQLEDQDFKNKELGEEWWYHKVQSEARYGHELIPYSSSNINLTIIKLTPRKLLQLLGTECGRNIIHPNIWINALFADYKWPYKIDRAITHGKIPREEVLLKSLPNWIITDVRFPNEAKAIKDRNEILIRTNRYKEYSNELYCQGGKQSPDWNGIEELPSTHESETALDNYQGFDYVIDNNGTIEELVDKVKEILIKEKIL